jgi:hypothetical protein
LTSATVSVVAAIDPVNIDPPLAVAPAKYVPGNFFAPPSTKGIAFSSVRHALSYLAISERKLMSGLTSPALNEHRTG